MAEILVIDDEDMVRTSIRLILEKEGHKIVEAQNGLIGLQRIAERAYDLVITDIIMPDKEGIETIIELRKIHPSMKIIAISGGGRMGRNNVLDVAAKFGANAAVSKPFDRKDLVATVKRVLGG
ncbi:MAG: response regulator [Alphaproteobacteria bacterium]|nr:response regulator [Alphaproteobacteria bacterium]